MTVYNNVVLQFANEIFSGTMNEFSLPIDGRTKEISESETRIQNGDWIAPYSRDNNELAASLTIISPPLALFCHRRQTVTDDRRKTIEFTPLSIVRG